MPDALSIKLPLKCRMFDVRQLFAVAQEKPYPANAPNRGFSIRLFELQRETAVAAFDSNHSQQGRELLLVLRGNARVALKLKVTPARP